MLTRIWEDHLILDAIRSVFRSIVYIPTRPAFRITRALDEAWNTCFWVGFAQGALWFAVLYLLARDLARQRKE